MNCQRPIVAIETSGPIGRVALADGPLLLAEQRFGERLNHAAELLPTIDLLCRRQNWRPRDIQQVYVSAGPGSFTGLRVAITAAKTLSFAHGMKIVAVPSTEALVLNAHPAADELGLDIARVAVVLEAGRGQVFAAVFERDSTPQSGAGVPDGNSSTQALVPGFRTLMPAAAIYPTELLAYADARPLYLMGQGISYHQAELCAGRLRWLPEDYWHGSAASVHRCGWLRAQAGLFAQPDKLTPTYLRRPEAVVKWEHLHGPSKI